MWTLRSYILLAHIHLDRGNLDEALDWLKLANERASNMKWWKTCPLRGE